MESKTAVLRANRRPSAARNRKHSSFDLRLTTTRSWDPCTTQLPPGAASTMLLSGRQLAGVRASLASPMAATGDLMTFMWRGEEGSSPNPADLLLGDDACSLLISLGVWLCVFVLLTLFVVLLTIVLRAAPAASCTHPACMRLDAALAKSVSERRSQPCDDFFKYVCPAARKDLASLQVIAPERPACAYEACARSCGRLVSFLHVHTRSCVLTPSESRKLLFGTATPLVVYKNVPVVGMKSYQRPTHQ